MKNFKLKATVFCVFLFVFALISLVGCASGFTQKKYTAKSAVTRLELEVDVADLVIKPTTNKTKIEYQENSAYSFYVWEGSGTLLMESNDGVNLFGGTAPKIVVYLTAGCELNVEVDNGSILIDNGLTVANAEISLDNGNITVNNLTATKSFVSISVDNGNVVATNVSAVDYVDLSAENGQINGYGLTSYLVETEASLGEVKLNGVNCELLKSEVNSGNLNLDKITVATSLDAKVNLGDLKLTLVGEQPKFLVSAKVDVGSCNANNTTIGEVAINLSVYIGNITVGFLTA